MALLLASSFFNAVSLGILNTLRQMLAEKVTTSTSSVQGVGIFRISEYLYEIHFGFDVCVAVKAGLKEKWNRKTSKLQILGIQKERETPGFLFLSFLNLPQLQLIQVDRRTISVASSLLLVLILKTRKQWANGFAAVTPLEAAGEDKWSHGVALVIVHLWAFLWCGSPQWLTAEGTKWLHNYLILSLHLALISVLIGEKDELPDITVLIEINLMIQGTLICSHL